MSEPSSREFKPDEHLSPRNRKILSWLHLVYHKEMKCVLTLRGTTDQISGTLRRVDKTGSILCISEKGSEFCHMEDILTVWTETDPQILSP